MHLVGVALGGDDRGDPVGDPHDRGAESAAVLVGLALDVGRLDELAEPDLVGDLLLEGLEVLALRPGDRVAEALALGGLGRAGVGGEALRWAGRGVPGGVGFLEYEVALFS